MTKTKMYKYLGRNGILTTRIILDGIPHILMYSLVADEGKVLTNGELFVKTATIEADEIFLWTEVADQSV